MQLTDKQQTEALKLVRVLASYPCHGHDEDTACVQLELPRAAMCGPCHACDFIDKLPKALR